MARQPGTEDQGRDFSEGIKIKVWKQANLSPVHSSLAGLAASQKDQSNAAAPQTLLAKYKDKAASTVRGSLAGLLDAIPKKTPSSEGLLARLQTLVQEPPPVPDEKRIDRAVPASMRD